MSIENNEKYSAELKHIEEDAIIECMLLEVEALEMKLQAMILVKEKFIRELACENYCTEIYKRYGIAVMKPLIIKNKMITPKVSENIKLSTSLEYVLRIATIMIIVTQGWGWGFISLG